MEHRDFRENRITTAWLDERIRLKDIVSTIQPKDTQDSSKNKNTTAAPPILDDDGDDDGEEDGEEEEEEEEERSSSSRKQTPAEFAAAARRNFGTAPMNSGGRKDKSKRVPPLYLSIIGAVVESSLLHEQQHRQYTSSLARGHVPDAELLSVSSKHALIYDNVKYMLEVGKTGENSYVVSPAWPGNHDDEDSSSTVARRRHRNLVNANVRKLADNGRLVLLGTKSYVAYRSVDAAGIRYTIAGRTYIFENEYDPTQLKVSEQAAI